VRSGFHVECKQGASVQKQLKRTFYNGQLYLLMMAVIKCIIAQITY